MTPQWASQLLDQNTHNRSCSPARVKQIANDILEGRWLLTPQTVSVGSDGRLLDGQHRLMAIASSEVAVQLMLATDCDPKCFAAIDTGQSRTPGDILKIEGASHYAHVGSIIRAVHLYRTIPGLVWVGGAAMLSKQQIIELYRSDPEGYETAAKLAKNGHTYPCVQVTAVGAFLYLYASDLAPTAEDRQASREYFQLFCSGEMLSSGNPILTFRNWEAANWKISRVKQFQTQLACHIKAFKYWKDGVTMKQFKAPQIPPMPHL